MLANQDFALCKFGACVTLRFPFQIKLSSKTGDVCLISIAHSYIRRRRRNVELIMIEGKKQDHSVSSLSPTYLHKNQTKIVEI